MNKLSVTVVTALSLLGTVCLVSAQGAQPDSRPGRIYIAPQVRGRARRILQDAMTGLRPEDRKNVVVISPNGESYANRPELKGLFTPLRRLKGNVYRSGTGRLFTLPAPEPKPGVVPRHTALSANSTPQPELVGAPAPHRNSGPYIRYYTTPLSSNTQQGFAYESATVHLPEVTSSAINVSENLSDRATANIYMGGWSGGSDSLDVGFYHEGAAQGSDAWVAFCASGSDGTANPGTQNTINDPPIDQELGHGIRFLSGADASIKFYVTSTPAGVVNLNFVWSGTCFDANNQASLGYNSYTIVFTDTSGWSPDGSGMVLKSMTSIAQENPSSSATNKAVDDFFDGSLLRNVVWKSCMLARTGTGTPQPWLSFTDSHGVPVTGHCEFYPTSGVALSSGAVQSPNNPSNTPPSNNPNRTDGIVVP